MMDAQGPFFLLIGQSNMAGRGHLDDLTAAERQPVGVSMFRDRRWQPARHPLQDPDDPTFAVPADRVGGVGPGVAFACALRDSLGGADVGLLLCARGGGGITRWAQDGPLYVEALARTRLAGRSRPLTGLLVHVGEGDTASASSAAGWVEAFRALVQGLRDDLEVPHLPTVFAGLGSDGIGGRTGTTAGNACVSCRPPWTCQG